MSSPTNQQVSFINTEASVLLDLVRGIAAILVLLSHWKIMFFVDYPKIPHHRIWFAIPYVISDAGHQAVLIFFVLSGYLISGSVFRSANRGQWQWRTYLTHRFVRLWVVLLPGLYLGGIWDWIGLHYVNHANLYTSICDKSHGIDISQNLAPKIFFGNIVFLQTIFVSDFGSNGALWSLANEFWYYILFPLGWLALRRDTSLARRILYTVPLCLLLWIGRSSVVPLFPVWLAGTGLALLPVPRFGNKVRIVAGTIYTPLVFVFAKVDFLPGLAQDYIFGAITFLFFWIILSAREPSGPSLANHLARQSARFSYTLYIVHMPALLLLTALFVGQRLWSPTDLHHDALALAVLLALTVYAYLIASVTEFRTDRVRTWVEQNLLRSKRTHLLAKNR
jgi:peptidoglycan/LPS O-acetylase OafA/YrhL